MPSPLGFAQRDRVALQPLADSGMGLVEEWDRWGAKRRCQTAPPEAHPGDRGLWLAPLLFVSVELHSGEVSWPNELC